MILFWGLQSWEPFLIISLPTLGSYSVKNYDTIPATKGSEEISVYLLLKKLFFFPISHPNQFALLLCLQTLHILDWKEHYKRSCRPHRVSSVSLPLLLFLSFVSSSKFSPDPCMSAKSSTWSRSPGHSFMSGQTSSHMKHRDTACGKRGGKEKQGEINTNSCGKN